MNGMRLRHLFVVGVLLPLAGGGLVMARASGQATQAPVWRGKNLQVLPKDISQSDLMQQMREFSMALDVRCQHCHTGGDGTSLDGVVFESDDKPAKQTARAMIEMMASLNDSVLPAITTRQTPPIRMTCAICHRGLPRPRTLATELRHVLEQDGIPAAVARYRDLRENSALLGLFRFTEWEMNELATGLAREDKVDAAVSMLELNATYYPASVAIDVLLADLYVRQGDRPKAIARLEAALARSPQDPRVIQTLARIRKDGGLDFSPGR
jgi:hypothetical protein